MPHDGVMSFGHQWEEDEQSKWLNREHWQFYYCTKCGISSYAVKRGEDPHLKMWPMSCDEVRVSQVMDS
jgi:hypothetical protein